MMPALHPKIREHLVPGVGRILADVRPVGEPFLSDIVAFLTQPVHEGATAVKLRRHDSSLTVASLILIVRTITSLSPSTSKTRSLSFFVLKCALQVLTLKIKSSSLCNDRLPISSFSRSWISALVLEALATLAD